MNDSFSTDSFGRCSESHQSDAVCVPNMIIFVSGHLFDMCIDFVESATETKIHSVGHISLSSLLTQQLFYQSLVLSNLIFFKLQEMASNAKKSSKSSSKAEESDPSKITQVNFKVYLDVNF